MNLRAVAAHLQARLANLLGVYAFGSRIADGGQHAKPDSHLDLEARGTVYG